MSLSLLVKDKLVRERDEVGRGVISRSARRRLEMRSGLTGHAQRLSVIAVTAMLAMMPLSRAQALTVQYTISASAVPAPNTGEDFCHSGILVTDCTVGYSNIDPQFPPIVPLGAWNQVGVVAEAFDGPVHTSSGATAQFGVLSGTSLLAVYAASDGLRTVRDEIVNSDGSISTYQASAYAYAVVGVGLFENIIATIPPELDGLPIDVSIRVPISVLGNGSSYGELFAFAGGHSDHTLFGYKDVYRETAYFNDSSLELVFPIRFAGDATRTVTIPFQLVATFYSASLVLGGPGLVDASHSIGVKITSVDGVTFRSESGALDALLTTPTSFAFSGFFPPVDSLPVVNVAKAGSAIPVKFSLGGDFGLNILADGYPNSEMTSCDTQTAIDVIETTVAAGESQLAYDATQDEYTYVWKTTKAWAGTCRRLTVKLSDGSEHEALFKFSK